MDTKEQVHSDSAAIRRRRRLVRPIRDKTPDPGYRLNGSTHLTVDADEETESSQVNCNTASETDAPQIIRMQIRPPNHVRSAHESKILRRRDKNFGSSATRSQSQPRTAERLSSPEAEKLVRTNKRSLSSPRQKETEFSEDENQFKREQREQVNDMVVNLSRLERNLQKFEDERKRFDIEKRQFEKERRELKLKHKEMFDNEERRRILQSYRKLSDRIQLPQDVEERRRMVHSLRLQRNEVPTIIRRPPRHSACDESSTQFSSSEAEDSNNPRYLSKHLSPTRKSTPHVVATVRGPPPPPPVVPQRKSVSRNNSLSPIRPQRRSKTPEQRAEFIQQNLDENKEISNISNDDQQLRKRKPSLDVTDSLENTTSKQLNLEETVQKPTVKIQNEKDLHKSKKLKFIENFFKFFDFSKKKIKKPTFNPEIAPAISIDSSTSIFSRKFLKLLITDIRYQYQRLKYDYPLEVENIRLYRNRCISHVIILIMLCGFGGLIFRYTEGYSENIYKCEVRKVKRDFIDNLWTVSHNMREDDWKNLARQKLRKFEEELHVLQSLGLRYYPGQKSWNFVNSIIYSWTVITTIGYGHITPKTMLGQALTIVYAIIGIPMFLILLADFGKLFTRCMKFIWAYVRRVYYTGTCRKIRHQHQVQSAIGGFNTMYDMAIRRPSTFFGIGGAADIESQISEAEKSTAQSHPETPTSPYPETFEVDDEFNLPVSLASILLIIYILLGTSMYYFFEGWDYFESFYFVFISMSTIGFGDLVPNSPFLMMGSIIYLIFGLALTSMFINVVQIKLSDTFKDASAKIGATIGLGMASELGDDGVSQAGPPSELASIHGSRLDKITEDETFDTNTQPPPILRSKKPYFGEPNFEEISTPSLLPRRQVSIEEKQETNKKEKKKRRFF